ncbi:MAG: primosomal protein N' [Betaproteobacteria bacterium]|nr:MAG: primosomal protein N' [Betaproteobacteria bacterium]
MLKRMRVLTKLTVEVPLGIGRALDYTAPVELAVRPFSCVEISVGSRAHVGLVTAVSTIEDDPALKLKAISRVISASLPAAVVELARFVADYYQVGLGMACGLITPNDAAPAAQPIGWRLTAIGQDAIAQITAKQTAHRSLADAFAASDDGLLSVEVRSTLSASAKKVLNDWLQTGRAEPVFAAQRRTSFAPNLPAFTAEQSDAVVALRAKRNGFHVSLLHGVTGSGKTEVYLDLVAATLNAGKQVMLLVPEINLTPQLVDRVIAALPDVPTAIMHSKISPTERNRAWHDVYSGSARLIIGTRLAVFAPAAELGLIVIDEEHDSSYKQGESPRYHARDAAIVRAQHAGIPVVLASATPSLESWRQARAGRYQHIRLHQRATASQPSAMRLIPAKGRRVKSGLSELLADGISDRLAKKEQSLVLVNRRGFSPALYCPHCAWSAPCKRCDAKLTLHQITRSLRCHHCGFHTGVPTNCPACGHPELAGVGVGTQKLEAALIEAFPDARIARADTDALTGKYAWQQLYEKILAREIDIVVGTQMLAKGHDFPALTLVGVVDADRALFSTDFRAQEDMYALLTQVAGRAGRHSLPGEVMIQTEFPDHPIFQSLLKSDYDGFADATLASRDTMGLPPLTRMALIRGESKDAQAVAEFFTYAHSILRNALAESDGEVFAPQPAPLARKADFTRWTMTAIAPKVRPMADALAKLRDAMQLAKPKVRWAIDVDPYDFS